MSKTVKAVIAMFLCILMLGLCACGAFDFDTYIDAMWVGTYARHNVSVPVRLVE